MKCYNCGQENGSGCKFCINCGSPLPLETAPDADKKVFGQASSSAQAFEADKPYAEAAERNRPEPDAASRNADENAGAYAAAGKFEAGKAAEAAQPPAYEPGPEAEKRQPPISYDKPSYAQAYQAQPPRQERSQEAPQQPGMPYSQPQPPGMPYSQPPQQGTPYSQPQQGYPQPSQPAQGQDPGAFAPPPSPSAVQTGQSPYPPQSAGTFRPNEYYDQKEPEKDKGSKRKVILAIVIPVLAIGLLAAGFFLLPVFEPLRSSIFDGENVSEENAASKQIEKFIGSWEGRFPAEYPAEEARQSLLLGGLEEDPKITLLINQTKAELHFKGAAVPLDLEIDGDELSLRGYPAKNEQIEILIDLEDYEDDETVERLKGELIYDLDGNTQQSKLNLRAKDRALPELEGELRIDYTAPPQDDKTEAGVSDETSAAETSAAEATTPEETTAEETTPEETTAEQTTPEETTAEQTTPEETTAEQTTPEETTAEKTTTEKTTAEKTTAESTPAETSPKTSDPAETSASATDKTDETSGQNETESTAIYIPYEGEIDETALRMAQEYLCDSLWIGNPITNYYANQTETYYFGSDGSFLWEFWEADESGRDVMEIDPEGEGSWSKVTSLTGLYAYVEDPDEALNLYIEGADSRHLIIYVVDQNTLELRSDNMEGPTVYLNRKDKYEAGVYADFPDMDGLLDFQDNCETGEDGNKEMKNAVSLIEGYYYEGDTAYYEAFDAVFQDLDGLTMRLTKADTSDGEEYNNLWLEIRSESSAKPFELKMRGHYDEASGVFAYNGMLPLPTALIPEGYEEIGQNDCMLDCQFRIYRYWYPETDTYDDILNYIEGRLSFYSENNFETEDGGGDNDPIEIHWSISKALAPEE